MGVITAGFGGGQGYYAHYYGRLTFNETVVDTANNRSYIELFLDIQADASPYSFYGYNNEGRIYVNGGQWAYGNYTGTVNSGGQRICQVGGWVGHDSNGDVNINVKFTIDSGYAGHSENNTGWWLTHINRYANIDGFNIDWVTDSAIRIAWHSDSPVDYITWWSNVMDGGGHHDEPAGGQGWFVKEFYNLRSQTQYDFRVGVRRDDSDLWSFSGTAYATTLDQNRFFDMVEG